LPACATELGADFIRILGIFSEDGEKSVARIEDAKHRRDAAGFRSSRAYDEDRSAPVRRLHARRPGRGNRAFRPARARIAPFPDQILPQVARLRPIYVQTMALFQRETNPLVPRRPTFRSRGEQPGIRPALDGTVGGQFRKSLNLFAFAAPRARLAASMRKFHLLL
jgi:hypothetical protein